MATKKAPAKKSAVKKPPAKTPPPKARALSRGAPDPATGDDDGDGKGGAELTRDKMN